MSMKARGLACALLCLAACRENDRFQDLQQGALPLSASQARAQLAGNFEGELLEQGFALCLDPDGRARGRVGDKYDTGEYRVSSQGLLCLRWKTWGEGRETCAQYYLLHGSYRAYDTITGQRFTLARKSAIARCSR